MTTFAELQRGQSDVPPLSNGDHLSLAEFERLWDLHPEIKKAELIHGVVFLDMTVSQTHARAHAFVMAWLSPYWLSNADSVELLVDGTLRLLDSHDLQPDVMLRKLEGESQILDAGARVSGPPELVVEISLGSSSRDLGNKREIYAAAGVPEYVVWQLHNNRIDWFVLEGDRYVAVEPGESGIIESRGFPGLRLPIAAMLNYDARALAAGE